MSLGTFALPSSYTDGLLPPRIAGNFQDQFHEINNLIDRIKCERDKSKTQVRLLSNKPQHFGINSNLSQPLKDTLRLCTPKNTSKVPHSNILSKLPKPSQRSKDDQCDKKSDNSILLDTKETFFLTRISREEEKRKKLSLRKKKLSFHPFSNIGQFTRKIDLPKIQLPGAVPFKLRLSWESMQPLFRIRDKRIELAKGRRQNMEVFEFQRLMASIEKKETIKKQLTFMKQMKSKQMLLLLDIKVSFTLYTWFTNARPKINEYRIDKTLNTAAQKIQTLWKKEMFARKALEARDVNSQLKKIVWRLRIWCRSTRRRLNAQLIRRFFSDFLVQYRLHYAIHCFRNRVLEAQRLIRSFIECKKARCHALERSWAIIEKEICNSEDTHNKRRRKNALTPLKLLPLIQTKHNKWSKIQFDVSKSQTISGQRNICSTRKNNMNTSNCNNIKEEVADVDIIRLFCKHHLEELRKDHLKNSEVFRDFSSSTITMDHEQARKLLLGEKIELKFEGSRRWPPFLLYHKGRQTLRKLAETFHKDDDAYKRQIDQKLALEERWKRTIQSNLDTNGTVVLDNNMEKHGTRNGDKMSGNCNSYRISVLSNQYKTTDGKIRELWEIFQLVDDQHKGCLNVNDLDIFFGSLGVGKEAEPILEGFNNIQTLKTEVVEFETFVKIVRGRNQPPAYSQQKVINAFQSFAKEMPLGFIQRDQLLMALQSYAGKWDASKAHACLCEVGLTKSSINYNEFVQIVFS